ncbi:MAG: hypothetical protein WBV74_20890 [Pseudonocardiaceae bacterium]
MAALEQPITVLTDQLLDPLNGQGEADLLADCALPPAVHVACRMIGILELDYPLFCSWAQTLIRPGLDDAGVFEGGVG